MGKIIFVLVSIHKVKMLADIGHLEMDVSATQMHSEMPSKMPCNDVNHTRSLVALRLRPDLLPILLSKRRV